ncbi:synergin gamma isoform X2 [Patella vulgata]|uniref:synergin gamma isoform X2 n=1 Tax=Patella vulgata TaxID=6465 RepID=UPI0021806C03|nr:synergin gamma isoform X2 [Patella vulgata]
MADNRDMRFPGGQPGFNNMISGTPQFIQPGMQGYPMMQQPMGMTPGMAHQMYPMQQYPMARPRMAPPSYNQHMATNFNRPRGGAPGSGPRPRQPPSQKDIQFQMQQQRLKQFGQTKHVKADADKFIESMFGKTEKPKPKDLRQKQPQIDIPNQTGEPDVDDDGFGDFLQGPMTAAPTPPPAQVVPATVSNISPAQLSTNTTDSSLNNVPAVTKTAMTPPQIPKQEKKDLMTMMMECSDLKAPQKAKSFQKPLVKDVKVQPHKTITYHQSQQARQWQVSAELEDLFHEDIPPTPASPPAPTEPNAIAITASPVSPPTTNISTSGGVLPEWCLFVSEKLPPLYNMVYEAALVDGKIDTNRLYPILVLSNLPREVLGYIWSMSNTTTPGQLIQSELNAILALIALAQNNHSIMSIDILKRCPQPPIPFLGQNSSAPSSVAQQQQQQPGTQATVSDTPVVNSNQPQGLPNTQPVMPSPSGIQATIPSPSTSFQVVAPVPQPVNSGMKPNSTQSTISQPPRSFPTLSEPAIITHTSEDDFADFQSADKPTEDEFGDFMGTNNPACITVEEKPPYVISVPKPDPKIIDQMTPDEKYNSNVQSFFGSSGSSGHTTPNSLDEEYYTDCRDSTSQLSTSEQSESEDIKNFETYVEEFNRKKEMLHPESPLHNPFPRLPVVQQTSADVVIPPLPPVRSGLQLSSEATSSREFTDFKSAPVKTAAQDSDPDFADFQAAPKSSGSEPNLLGEEDKYGALRSLVIEEPASTNEATATSEPVTPFAQFGEECDQNESEGEWADFASAVPEEDTNTKTSDKNTLNLIADNVESDWADFGDTKTPTAGAVNDEPSWNPPASSFLGAPAIKSDITAKLVQNAPANSLFPSVAIKTENTDEDWSDFSGAASNDQRTPIPSENTDDDWFNTPVYSDTSLSSNSVVTVKKSHLQSDEIMGMFKVRDDPGTQASYKLPNLEQKVNKFRQPSLDDDNDNDPPPLDYLDDDEDHGFSRGYDLDEYNSPSPIGGYGYGNGNKGMFLNQVAKKVAEKRLDDRDRSSLSPETEDDANSYSSKDTDSYNWKDRSKQLREDSQSVCSLELPAKGNSLKTNSDNGGSDSQSVSSMEFCNFEGSSKTPVSAESKSLDSLDFPPDGNDNEGVEVTDVENTGIVNSSNSTSNNMSQTTLPGGVIKTLVDKYNITDEIVTSDRYSYEWERCLDNCWRMIKDSNTIFNSISSSSVCNEVLKSSQGSSYITGIVEIYRVACRVMTAMKAHNLTTPPLERLLKDIDLAWNNLTAFFVGASVLPDIKAFDFKFGVMKSDSEEAQFNACGVCLLNVDVKIKATWCDEDVTKLTYGRRQYHAPCANFWVNCVDSTLPGLRLPELL